MLRRWNKKTGARAVHTWTALAGDSLVVPKGFSGTWEMIGNFRELVVIEKKAYELYESTP